jgi:hypothetical protein
MKSRYAVILIAATFAATPALAASPFDGTWKVDPSTAHFAQKPDVYVLTANSYSCKSCTPPMTIKADGAFHPVAGAVGMDAMSAKIVDANTVLLTYSFHGKPVGENKRVVSADGKTLTYHFTDLSAPSGPPPVTTAEETRIAAGPAGAHAISGTWQIKQGTAKASDAVLTMMLKVEGKTVSMMSPSGYGYDAPLGGAAVPIKGDPAAAMATVKMTNPATLVETDSVKGKVTSISTMALSPGGKTMKMTSYNPIDKSTATFTLTKQ